MLAEDWGLKFGGGRFILGGGTPMNGGGPLIDGGGTERLTPGGNDGGGRVTGGRTGRPYKPTSSIGGACPRF